LIRLWFRLGVNPGSDMLDIGLRIVQNRRGLRSALIDFYSCFPSLGTRFCLKGHLAQSTDSNPPRGVQDRRPRSSGPLVDDFEIVVSAGTLQNLSSSIGLVTQICSTKNQPFRTHLGPLRGHFTS